MKVSDILAHLSVRLNDININAQKLAGNDTNQSQAFLIKLIELHQNELLAEFDFNIQHFTKELNAEKEVVLDFDINKLIAAFLNDTPLNLMSYAFVIKNKLLGGQYFYEKAQKTYAFTNQVSGTLDIYAVKKAVLADENSQLILSDEFTNLLVLSVFVDLYRSQVAPDNTQKLVYYTQMLNDEKQKVKALISSKRTKTAFLSPFVKV